MKENLADLNKNQIIDTNKMKVYKLQDIFTFKEKNGNWPKDSRDGIKNWKIGMRSGDMEHRMRSYNIIISSRWRGTQRK